MLYYFKQIDLAIGRLTKNAYRRDDLTLSQVRLLLELGKADNNTMSLKELERCLHVAQPTIVGLVKRLEAKGLVQKSTDPSDSRVRLVELTPAGIAYCSSSVEHIDAMEKGLMAPLTKKEQREFERMLRLVLEHIDNVSEY